MEPLNLLAQCAPELPAPLMDAVVKAESDWRPLAIGLDGSQPAMAQPNKLADAVAIAEALSRQGRGFSVGLAQIHVSHVRREGWRWEQAFDPCSNVAFGQRILRGFQAQAEAAGLTGSPALHAALRGYNAGRIDRMSGEAYARRVLSYLQAAPASPPAVPAPGDSIMRSRMEPSAMERDGAVARPRDIFATKAPDVFARKAGPAGF